MSAFQYVMPVQVHNDLVAAVYLKRGYSTQEADQGARFAEMASWHGIKTHNALKALHLDELFGSKTGGCVPGAKIVKKKTPFKAAEAWDAGKKLGQAVAFEAMDTCMKLADEYGVGMVSVDNAFHYLWGGGYVIDAAKKGYIAYTNCTSTLAEVVPFGGRFPTLGTNPHSWGFPTTDLVGFPICIDWATSTVAMGRVQQLKREGKPLPPGSAVDKEGRETSDPNAVAALLPFGAHKGYGMSLLNELYGAYVGGSLPTIRGRADRCPKGEKTSSVFYFQCIRPEAMGVQFAAGRDQKANVKAVLDDVMGHGNTPPEGRAMLPGKLEADAARRSQEHQGLIFTEAEVKEFEHLAQEAGWAMNTAGFKKIPA